MRQKFFLENELTFEGVHDLVDAVWGQKKPPRPQEEVYVLKREYSGQIVKEKFINVGKKMIKNGTTMMLITALDDLAWILNLRGSDIDFNPLFFAFGILHRD